MSSTSVCVIGSGPCGLAVLHAFVKANAGAEIVCYERQSRWGGLWNYTWRTGTDNDGLPVHGSMYRYLWSNGPKECLEMVDYTFDEHFKQPIPSFPPRAVLESYILGRAKKDNLDKYINFSHTVISVEEEKDGDKTAYRVKVRNGEGKTTSRLFSHVVCCDGHFSLPNMPSYPGFDRYEGRLLHAHDFREAREFTGQRILLIGSSYSAEDIGLQVHKYGAKSVTISYRNNPMGFKWPESMKEVPLLTHVEGKTVHFKDGTSGEFDAIICCTGYQHGHSFMADSLRLGGRNRLFPPTLYKGVVWNTSPSVFYVGMQDQYYTFTMFDLQAFWVRDCILGKISLPSEQERSEDIANWVKREEALKTCEEDIKFQTDYLRDLSKDTDYTDDFSKVDTTDIFIEWEHDKDNNILTYRNKSFTSKVTGTVSPAHHTEWLYSLDDSIEAFMGKKKE